VEALAPVEVPALRERLREILDVMRVDAEHSWQLGPDGVWRPRTPRNGEKPAHVQATLMRRVMKQSRERQ